MTMKTAKKPQSKTTRGVYLNLDPRAKALMDKRAEAHNLKQSAYAMMAVREFMEIEEAFGGPIPQQFRALLQRNVGHWASEMKKITG